MPNYIYISIFILLNINLAYSQSDNRKFSTNKKDIEKMAAEKTKRLNKYVKLNSVQYQKVKEIYSIEVRKIDSLKYLPKEFYENPHKAQEAITEIKHSAEVAIKQLLTPQQYHELIENKDKEKADAIRKLHSDKKKN